MNTPLRSKPTQRLVQNIGRRAISSTTKAETKVVCSLVSWNGNAQSAVGSTRKKASVASSAAYLSPLNSIQEAAQEPFPMKLAHFIQRRRQQEQAVGTPTANSPSPLQEKWAKLASLTMDPNIGQVSETLNSRQALPQTLTESMADARPCMIASLDDPFTIVNVNQAWCAAYGYAKDEVLNRNVIPLLGSNIEDFVLEQLLLLGNGDTFAPPVVHYTKNGSPVEESLRVGSLSIGADVSDRYLVCVTEMTVSPASSNEPNQMITSLDDGAWGPVAA